MATMMETAVLRSYMTKLKLDKEFGGGFFSVFGNSMFVLNRLLQGPMPMIHRFRNVRFKHRGMK